jgi:putative ABC transport system permease protein
MFAILKEFLMSKRTRWNPYGGRSRLTSVALFQVRPRDPTIFGAVVEVLVAAGLRGCFIPASRATRVDPPVALRSD